MNASSYVVLVGPIQQENLALQYLAAAAEKAGHRAEIVGYGHRADLDAAVKAVIEKNPDLVGLGIAFQNNIEDYITFLVGLRDQGYRGHVTCGGHVPTFCHRELLRDVPGLDSAVRHEAEETLVEMLSQISHGQTPRNIAGLVWRDGDDIVVGPIRRPVIDLDALPMAKRSAEPYVVGGIPVDFIITARGCVGECSYCSIAAFTSEVSVPFRLRKPEPVAEEIATLYHERGARVMFVQDDLFILPSERKTVERCERVKDALVRRGVNDVVFWVKGRPETITPKVCKAVRDMGGIHMFLGVESASAKRLDYLGRTHLPTHNESAIALCREHGIVPSFNFMLFDPDSSLDDISATIDMAEQHADLPWNVCRTEIYSGTELRARLEAEHRLEGTYRSYGYRVRDERAEVMFRVLRVCFHERAFAMDSVLNRLISLSFARQLHESFFPSTATTKLSDEIMRLSVEIRRDSVAEMRSVVDYVTTSDVRDKARVRNLAIEKALAINGRDAAYRRRVSDLWDQLNMRGLALMAHRGGRRDGTVRMGWGVAAGS